MTDARNGHRLALGSDPEIAVASPVVAPEPHRSARCLARITRDGLTGWCGLPDQHEGEQCKGVLSAPITNTYGPPRWAGPRSNKR